MPESEGKMKRQSNPRIDVLKSVLMKTSSDSIAASAISISSTISNLITFNTDPMNTWLTAEYYCDS